MRMVDRKLIFPQVFIDTNRINALRRDCYMNQLEEWDANGVISIRLPEPAMREVEKAGDKQRAKTLNRLVPYSLITTDDERSTLKKIENVIGNGGALSRNDKTDALIVFTAWKYSRAVLVTADGGLLRKAEALKTAVGAQIMSARDLVNLLRKCIESRDRRARVESARTGLPVPTWVDQD